MSNKKPIPIHTLIGHTEADLDVFWPAWALQSWGRTLFPGIENADWVFIDAGSATYKGMDTDELLAKGYLMLDLGGGLFDHHRVGDRPAKENECSATLVAKYLGISDRPEVEGLLNYVKQNDLSGGGMTTDLASRLRRFYASGASELEARDMVYAEFEADYAHQVATFTPAVAEWKSKARLNWLLLPGGKKLKLAVIESDNQLVGRVARSKYGQDTAVLIQRHGSGRVFIAATPRYQLDLVFIAGLLRVAEAKTRKEKLELGPELFLPGAHPLVPQWYYFQSTDGKSRDVSIMNGSPKAKDVDPTWISLENIEIHVRKGLTLAHTPAEVKKLAAFLQQSAA